MAPARKPAAAPLLERPAWPVEVFFRDVVDLPPTTGDELIANGDGPPMFVLGRRRYVLREDGIAWLRDMRQRFPYVRRTRGKGGQA